MKFFLGYFLAVAVFGSYHAHAAKRNIVLFVTDDQSPDFGAYGNPALKTPNLDALAKDGTRFDNAFCTTASCSASRSVILSGLHNHANGHYGHQHSYHKFNSYGNLVSLPVYLSHGGYRTARCGKYHVAPENIFKFDQAIPGNSRSPVVMAENSKAFIGNDSEKPFFLYICTSDPHRGGGNANELPYKPDRFGNPKPGSKGYPGIKEVVYDPANVKVPGFLPDTPTCRAEIAQYYQSVARIDQGIGRLVEILKETNTWNDTLFIFISDHGIAMPGAKTTLYEGGMRSPCLVRNPYLKKRGIATDAMVSWVDLAPTILHFANVLDDKGKLSPTTTQSLAKTKIKGEQNGRNLSLGKFHGHSFLSVLDQEKTEGWDEVHASHTFHEITMYYPMRVVRERRYKLIWNIAYELPYPFASDLWAAPTWQAQWKQGMSAPYGAKTVRSYVHRPEFELYDVEKDPHEGNNLAQHPEHAKLLSRLQTKLKKFQSETSDPWIMKWRYE
ncbi:MAG: heparan N-sulfatase [Opitutales bacterium]|nr:heparan N-sulfatase [Opitutales bacterium]